MRPRTLIIATLIVWLLAFSVWTADGLVSPVDFMFERAMRRLVVCACGFLICLAMAAPLKAWRGRGMVARLALAAGLVIVGTGVYSAINQLVVYVIAPKWGHGGLMDLIDGAIMDVWVFLGWTALYFSMASDAEARSDRARLEKVQALALDAQNRMLLHQINPHFMFNSLNALSSLILQRETERAEGMVLALSAFLRRSIDNNLPDRNPLGYELDEQRRYLGIDQIRFGDRLRFVDHVPAELRGAMAPSLILQPLVENAVKHGVARTDDEVTIEVRAERQGDELVIEVRDNARVEGVATLPRLGVGLSNVRGRLEALYGAAATLECERLEPVGFCARLRLPLEVV
jgi:two-component system LytT family sensor kinase